MHLRFFTWLAFAALPLTAAELPAAKESDTRLHADGKGWRLDKAKISDPKRPRVLLIGDSILNGYLKTTIAALEGRAYVDAWVNPYNQSEHLNKNLLPQVLANGPYDVVHFNMGLHGWQEGRIKPGTFEPLTKGYVEVIKAALPNARILWASSTPVTAKGMPSDLDPEINATIIEHNRMAAKVMAEMQVPVNDFYTLLVDKRDLARGDRFHWTAPAYKMLSDMCVASVLAALPAEQGFTSIFNGQDLTGWDGDPKLWKVENGIVIGANPAPEAMANNSFLIWRGGTVKDFELRATIRVIGDNNSGIQYRSRELKDVAPWVITGYQCDIHPAIEHTGMTYEERGRGIFGLNGKNIMLDPEGALWQIDEHEPVKVDVSQWNEYTIIAQGNRLQHLINDQPTSELIDHHEKGRAMEGLLAIQLHKGNPNRVEIKELRLKVLPETPLAPFDPTKLPANAKKIEKPRTSRPQGTGTVAPVKK
jgi:hypothetical protein